MLKLMKTNDLLKERQKTSENLNTCCTLKMFLYLSKRDFFQMQKHWYGPLWMLCQNNVNVVKIQEKNNILI